VPAKSKRSKQRAHLRRTPQRQAAPPSNLGQAAQSVQAEKPKLTTIRSHGRVAATTTGRPEWPTLKYFWPSVKMTAIIAGACIVLIIILRFILG
jgi:hypothetical protein